MAASISQYSELKAAIIDYLERDDLTDYVDYFIDLAEDRFKRELRFREIQERETFTLAESARYFELSGLTKTFNDIKLIRLQRPNVTSGLMFTKPLVYVPVTEMTEMVLLDEYLPTHYTVWEQTLEFNAPADQAYTGEIFYYFEMGALDDSNTSNELLTRAADIYLYGSLAATAMFLQEDERLQIWEGLYREGRDSLNRSENDHNRPGPIVARVEGPPKQITRYRWR